MQNANRIWMSFPAAAAALCAMFLFEAPSGAAAMNSAAATTHADTVPGAWQHHKVTFNYYGITALNTCSGLENDVRLILRYFGARKDVKVSASGCPGGSPDTPSHNAWVEADFYTLSPTETSASGAVTAHWTTVDVTDHHPHFMDRGSCELIKSIKSVLLDNFSLRNIDYRTGCFPNTQSANDFSVKGEALTAAGSTSG
jgi:hypothetical protein